MVDVLRTIHVGCGNRGTWPLRLVTGGQAFRPVALVDIREVHLARAREITGLPAEACFSDLREAAGAVEADAVVVITPSRFHGQVIDLALELGKHVLVEKPFVLDLGQAKALVDRAERAGLCIVVAQNYRFRDTERTVRTLLAKQTYGEPGYATFIHHRYRPDPGSFTMDHAMLYEMSVHHFDSLLALFDREAVRVASRSFSPPWSAYPGATVVSALIELEGNLVVNYMGSLTSQFDYLGVRIECAEGALAWGSKEGLRLLRPGSREKQYLELLKSDRTPEATVLHLFHRYITEGKEPEISGRKNLATLRLIDATVRSSDSLQMLNV